MRNRHCECSDPACPACRGKCRERAVAVLWRSDGFGFPDASGVAMCEECSEDALASGVFGTRSAPETGIALRG